MVTPIRIKHSTPTNLQVLDTIYTHKDKGKFEYFLFLNKLADCVKYRTPGLPFSTHTLGGTSRADLFVNSELIGILVGASMLIGES
jgi:hypothetical protein